MCIVFLRYRDISGNLYTSLMNIYHMTRGTILVNKTYTSCAGITTISTPFECQISKHIHVLVHRPPHHDCVLMQLEPERALW